jgi:hypothetical protein
VSLLSAAIYQVVGGLGLGTTAIVVFAQALYGIPNGRKKSQTVNSNANESAIAFGKSICC